MLGDFVVRLAVALPLVCLAAIALLLCIRKGWIKLPGVVSASGVAAGQPPLNGLSILTIKSIGPAARIAHIQFQGQDLLLGITAQNLTLLSPPPQPFLSHTEVPAARPVTTAELSATGADTPQEQVQP